MCDEDKQRKEESISLNDSVTNTEKEQFFSFVKNLIFFSFSSFKKKANNFVIKLWSWCRTHPHLRMA